MVRLGNCVLPAGYVLIIAEKPKAAHRIASALGGRSLRKCSAWRVPFYLFYYRGRAYVVGSAVGHLFGLTSDVKGFPVFTYEWEPLWLIDKSARYTKPYYSVLEALSRYATLFINACDYDVEGSVIGYMVIKWFGDIKRARRMRFSALTPVDIRRAFERLEPLDWPLIEAGLARHELDWIWGINVSRALMEAVKSVSGRTVVLSAGRVQSPTLIEALRRDMRRKLFVPLPYFSVEARVRVGSSEIRVSLGSFEERAKALALAESLRRARYMVVASVERRRRLLNPPYPFNLGDLQMEAARVYGFSPSYTQEVAERLYLDALISYPRTNSQKIPDTVDVRSILEGLARNPSYRPLVQQLVRKGLLRPRQGPKDDPAHPAIHPTGMVPSRDLSRDEKRLYDLIVRRFLASMAPPAQVEQTSVVLRVPGLPVSARISGIVVVVRGWLDFYPFIDLGETRLPPLMRGAKLEIVRVRVRREYTRPPEAYTKASLVKWMESKGIGTEATRARIVELLFTRGYLTAKRGRIEVTDLGYAVAHVLERYFPQLTSVDLTRYFEVKLNNIRRGVEKRADVISEAKKLLSSLLRTYREKYMSVAGLELARSLGLIKPDKPCRICGREATSSGFCDFHYTAIKELYDGYREWVRRLGEHLSVHEYLRHLTRISATGLWVREAARFLLEHEDEVSYVWYS